MRNLKYLIILLCTLVLTGCLMPEGDCTQCQYPKVYFSYKDDAGADLLNKYVTSATLYFYDRKGNLVDKQIVSESQIKANEGVSLKDLPQGNYRVIVWANLGNRTNILSPGSVNGTQLKVGSTSSNVQESADALYYGSELFILSAGLNSNIVVNLNSIHVKLSIAVKGLSKTDLPQLHLSYLQSTYNFLGQPIESTSINFTPKATYDESKKSHISSINFLKPKSKLKNMVLKLSHQQLTKAINININEFIQTHYPAVDITNLSKEINLEMLIELDGVSVILTIPDWTDTDTGTEVHSIQKNS